MADSDNTTALPFVIPWRRGKSCAVDDKSKAGVASDGASVNDVIAQRLLAPVDPCVVLLQEWEQANHMAVVLCRLQQRLETRIRKAMGLSVSTGEPDQGLRGTSHPAPERHRPSGGGGLESGNPRVSSAVSAAALTASRDDYQTRWDALDAEVGYSRARAAEIEAVDTAEQILDAVTATPARSVAGVIAKLEIIVGGGESMGDRSAFPWPQIQSVLADLGELGEPGGNGPLGLAEGRTGDSQSGDVSGLGREAGRLPDSMSAGETAAGSQPQRR